MRSVLYSVLADGPRQTGPDFGKASPVGLLVLVLLLIGTFALVWSMNRQLRKVPASFDAPDTPGDPDGAATSGAPPTSSAVEADPAGTELGVAEPKEPGGQSPG